MNKISSKIIYDMVSDKPFAGTVEYDDFGIISDIREGVEESDAVKIEGIIIPGFINAHCHVELSYLWKRFVKGTGMAGFIDQINTLRNDTSLEEKKESISLWMDNMWKKGVSGMGDISNCSDSFEIKSSSLMKTRTFIEVFGTEKEQCSEVMNHASKLEKLAESCGLEASVTPHSCYTMSPELLRESSRRGLEKGFISYHSQESQEEEDMIKSGKGKMWENRKSNGMSTPPVTGTSSLEYFVSILENIRQAPFDEKILLVHEVCMSLSDMELVKEKFKNAFIALCPLSNIFIHNMLPPIDKMYANGMTLTVGTDSLSSNDDIDMAKEIFCIQKNFPSIPLGEILKWATLNGARFFDWDARLGSIEKGKAPGLTVITNIGKDGRLTSASTSYRII